MKKLVEKVNQFPSKANTDITPNSRQPQSMGVWGGPRGVPELNEGAMFEQNIKCNICLSIKM